MSYLEELEQNKEEMIASLTELVRIKSVREAPVRLASGEIAPFGAGVQEAYEAALKLGREMGFETLDVDGYGGHIAWSAPGATETFGMVGHLDVVPEGEGWTHDPYGGVVEDGFLYGRGTSDDKGPLIACLYAMKAIRDAGLQPKKNIRLILGLDEETGKSGMEYYLAKAGAPDLGITPDGDFPLIHGEMGILCFDLAARLKKHRTAEGLILSKLTAGTATNMVPGNARAVVASAEKTEYDRIRERAEAYSAATGYKLKVKKAGTSLAIESFGVPAHGATPSLGLNAFSILMDFLGSLSFAGEELNDFIEFYNSHIGFASDGEGLGCDLEDEVSGKLILNVGLAECSEELASCTVMIRYPVTRTAEEVYAAVEEKLKGRAIGIVKRTEEKPVFIEESDPLVCRLMEAYREETGDLESKPCVIGGGTYAKLMDRVLAFGGLFPGEEDRMHQRDERIRLESLFKMARIYARAIEKLCCEA